VAKESELIEINGNKYDPTTGRLISPAKPTTKKTAESYQSIDGFMKKPAQHAKNGVAAQAARLHRTAQDMHERAQRSKTLMRGGVKKPSASVITPRPEISKAGSPANPARENRAKSITKDARVNRFGHVSSLNPLARRQPKPSAAKLAPKAQTSAAAVARPMPSMVTSASHQQLERMLDHALARASAHKQAMNGKAGKRSGWRKVAGIPRWAAATAVIVVSAGILGFLAWQTMPQVGVKVATLGSSVDATVPAYNPSGFSFEGPLAFNENSVTMNFKSNADPSRSYSVIQKKSDWDSTSLLSNYLEPKAETYQTSTVKGSTVYIYGKDNHATWVSGGKWYVIEDKANLNSDQLIKIAESL